MPLRQYFTWVGSLLLMGLFAADWLFPVPVHAPRSEIPPHERVSLRIRSDQKWPERVVFDTTGSTVTAAADVHREPKVLPGRNLAEAGQPARSLLRTIYMAWFRIGEPEHATNRKTQRS